MHPKAKAEPVLVAWGIDTSGRPVFLGLAPGASESADAWIGFLADLADPTLVAHRQRHFGVSFATLRVRLLQEKLITRSDFDVLAEASPSRLALALGSRVHPADLGSYDPCPLAQRARQFWPHLPSTRASPASAERAGGEGMPDMPAWSWVARARDPSRSADRGPARRATPLVPGSERHASSPRTTSR